MFRVHEGQYRYAVDGVRTPQNGATLDELNLSGDGNNLSIQTTDSNIAVLTGTGNDTIDASRTMGMNFIDAGTGTNTIMGGHGANIFSIEAAATTIRDTITGFHAGDSLVMNAPDAYGFTLTWLAPTRWQPLTLEAKAQNAAPIYVALPGVASQGAFSQAIGAGGSRLTLMMHT